MAVKKKSPTKKKVSAKKKVVVNKKKVTTKKKGTGAKDTLVHIQASEALVTKLKIIAASRNQKLYELVNQFLSEWLQGQSAELESIVSLFDEYKK